MRCFVNDAPVTTGAPLLAQFQSYVQQGAIHYFIGGDTGSGKGGPSVSGSSSEITAWVEANFTATTVDGVTLYDLTA